MPHHRTALCPTVMREQRRRRPQRALLHRTRLQRPRLSPAPHILHATACAVLCGGTPTACPQPLRSWRASESGQHGSTAAQHIARCALLSDGCMLSRARLPHSLPARPLARRTLWRTHPQRHEPHGCRCRMPLRTHAPLAARGLDGARGDHWHAPSAVQLHKPHPPIHRIAVVPTASPLPSLRHSAHKLPSPAPSPHPAASLPVKRAACAREIWEPLATAPLPARGQPHVCIVDTLTSQHIRAASLTPLVQHVQAKRTSVPPFANARVSWHR